MAEALNVDEERFRAAIQARAQELELFWKRSLFFWGFIASAFVGYAATEAKGGSVPVALASFGFVCSLAWTLANRGSKYWQENWEAKVARVEEPIVGELFRVQEDRQPKGPFSAFRFSVSRLAIALSDFSAIVWAVLLARQGATAFDFHPWLRLGPSRAYLCFIGGTVLYSVVMVWGAWPRDQKTESAKHIASGSGQRHGAQRTGAKPQAHERAR